MSSELLARVIERAYHKQQLSEESASPLPSFVDERVVMEEDNLQDESPGLHSPHGEPPASDPAISDALLEKLIEERAQEKLEQLLIQREREERLLSAERKEGPTKTKESYFSGQLHAEADALIAQEKESYNLAKPYNSACTAKRTALVDCLK